MNIWAHHGDWLARRSVLKAGLQRLQPDLMALQESVVTADYDQVRDLLGEQYHVVHQRRRKADGTGMSLANRCSVTGGEEVDVLVTERVDPREFLGSLVVAGSTS